MSLFWTKICITKLHTCMCVCLLHNYIMCMRVFAWICTHLCAMYGVCVSMWVCRNTPMWVCIDIYILCTYIQGEKVCMCVSQWHRGRGEEGGDRNNFVDPAADYHVSKLVVFRSHVGSHVHRSSCSYHVSKLVIFRHSDAWEKVILWRK